MREIVSFLTVFHVSRLRYSHPDANPSDSMLDQLFHEKNRNRSLPCVQASLFYSLISNITLQILLSYCHTLLRAKTGRIS